MTLALSHFLLGIASIRNANSLFLSQTAFAKEILSRDDMISYNPCSTSADTKLKFSTNGNPVFDLTLYWSLARALQYLTFTHLDIAYVVQHVFLFMHDPRELYFLALKQILHYLKDTLTHGFYIRPSHVACLVSYSDVDWVGCPETRWSTSGFCVYLGYNLISWSLKPQHIVPWSSAEAEYRG